MLKPEEQAWYAEAEKRGVLSPAESAWYNEAKARGLAGQQAQTPAAQSNGPSAPEKIVRGMGDPVDASAQLLTHILPQGTVDAGNKLNNWLADKGVPLDRLPEGGLDQSLQQNEQAYQARRTAAGESGIDGWRMVGNIASPVNVIGATKLAQLPQAATAMGRIGQAVAGGAAMGAISAPVTEGDFNTEKTKQAALGGVTAGVLKAGGEGLSRVIGPKTGEAQKLLLNEGVNLTPGQVLGGGFKTAEEKLSSLPILGTAIKNAQKRGNAEFMQATANRALKPINESIPKSVTAGQDIAAHVRQKLSATYEDLLPKLNFKPDQQFAQEFQNLTTLAKSLPESESKYLEKTLQRELFSRMTPQGNMSGVSLNEADSAIGKMAKNFAGSTGHEKELGDALKTVQTMLRDGLYRSNPDKANELSKVRLGWANYARLRDAMKRSSSPDYFTPANLRAAVKGGDATVGKRAFTEGDALMQDLADAGKSVMSQQTPDSGTVGRAALAMGLGGAYITNPALLAGEVGGAALYAPPIQRALNYALTRRLPMADKFAQAINKQSGALAPLGGSVVNNLSQPQ